MSVLDGRSGEIHLAELIAALTRLRYDDPAHAEAIAACLGFGGAAPDMTLRLNDTPTIYDHRRPLPLPRAEQITTPRGPGLATPPVSRPQEALPSETVESQLLRLDPQDATEAIAKPAWLDSGYQRVDPETGVAPARDGLFPARTARGVLTAALASRRLENEIDVPQLVRCVVQQRLPPQLPRLLSPTLSSGCQLLLDFGDSMLPWWEDLRQLARQVSAVLGEERVRLFDFTEAPGDARRWRPDTEKLEGWQPEPGRPVLVATDFGIRGDAMPSVSGTAWEAFVTRCAAAQCTLLILVPWSRSFWPKDLGPYPQLIHWHPSTSATMLRRQRGISHRSAR